MHTRLVLTLLIPHQRAFLHTILGFVSDSPTARQIAYENAARFTVRVPLPVALTGGLPRLEQRY